MRRILAMLISAFFFVSCASAIQVDSDYVLEYLYKDKIQKINWECFYGHEDGLYLYNCVLPIEYYSYATSGLSESAEVGKWLIAISEGFYACKESKVLLDQEDRETENVMVTLSCNIGTVDKPVYLPLLIFKNDIVLYNISDSIQPAE